MSAASAPPPSCPWCSDQGVVWFRVPAIGVAFMVPCACRAESAPAPTGPRAIP